MAEKRKSLGRGLDALLGGSTQTHTSNTTKSLNELPIEEVGPGPFQPRKKINEQQLSELSASIEAQGVLQPIVVRERAVQDSQTGIRYEIIAGERRWRAAQLANLETIPAVVKTVSDIDAVAIALIENIQRENLNPLEEANAFQRLIIEYEMTHQEVANSVGRARASISNMLRLLELPNSVQELLNNSSINMGHARALLSIQDPAMQLEVANLVAEKKLSVRETEKLVKSIIEGKTKEKKQPQKKDQDIINLEDTLTNQLGAKVTIKHNQAGAGTLTISYTSTDELEGILNKIK
ncbi:ParB/RepB/Spo0J family partition protein [Gammaproteobacteria bacterium]|nr:ParB/RepB/Spo0J family partition protein [Gammaproteobacteria bacterium]